MKKPKYYRVAYGSNKNVLHYEQVDNLERVKTIIDWCIEKELIVFEIKPIFR